MISSLRKYILLRIALLPFAYLITAAWFGWWGIPFWYIWLAVPPYAIVMWIVLKDVWTRSRGNFILAKRNAMGKGTICLPEPEDNFLRVLWKRQKRYNHLLNVMVFK